MATATSEAPLPGSGWRGGLGLAVSAVAGPAAATLLLGIGGVAAVVVVGLALQLVAAAGYGPDVWPGTPRRLAAVRVLPFVATFWLAALVAVPHLSRGLATGDAVVAIGAAILLCVVLGTVAASDATRAIWAWPLAVVVAIAPLAVIGFRTSPPRPLPRSISVDAAAPGAAGRLAGRDGSEAGMAIAGAGDVNHDGRADWLVGIPSSGLDPGELDLVYGHAGASAAHSHPAARLVGRPGDELGFSVAVVGDLNGDGRRDYLIGAPTAANAAGVETGEAYVVYAAGHPRRERIANLDRPGGPRGFRIDGAFAGDAAGYSVADAGDVNGDGVDDLLVGVPRVNGGEPTSTGAVYVVFGKHDRRPVDLARIGSRGDRAGYRIQSITLGDAGVAVARAGDVNGDGLDDTVIGMPTASVGTRYGTGTAFVVYGKRGATTVDVSHVGAPGDRRGFRIDGARAGDQAGASVAGVGDLNGDGRPDILVGAPHASNRGRPQSGSAYVIYGGARSGVVDLRTLSTAISHTGFRIDGAIGRYCFGVPCGDQAGSAVAPAGDVNGDGRADVLVGAATASRDGVVRGAVFVVYGQRAAAGVDLALVGTPGDPHGYRIDGAGSLDQHDFTVAAGGDVDGDGRPDILIGAADAREGGGMAYAVTARPGQVSGR